MLAMGTPKSIRLDIPIPDCFQIAEKEQTERIKNQKGIWLPLFFKRKNILLVKRRTRTLRRGLRSWPKINYASVQFT
jgi:hypothetical protein